VRQFGRTLAEIRVDLTYERADVSDQLTLAAPSGTLRS